MKLTREGLKAIVKELLLEVLREGIGGPVPTSSTSSPARLQPGPQRPRRQAFDPALDTPVVRQSDSLREAIRRESGGNPVMADILADTAATTLREQLSHGEPVEGRPSAGHVEQFNGEVSDVFGASAGEGDGSSHWADLAFMPSMKKTA